MDEIEKESKEKTKVRHWKKRNRNQSGQKASIYGEIQEKTVQRHFKNKGIHATSQLQKRTQ